MKNNPSKIEDNIFFFIGAMLSAINVICPQSTITYVLFIATILFQVLSVLIVDDILMSVAMFPFIITAIISILCTYTDLACGLLFFESVIVIYGADIVRDILEK